MPKHSRKEAVLQVLKAACKLPQLRWLELIYMRVGYVFESRFSAGMI